MKGKFIINYADKRIVIEDKNTKWEDLEKKNISSIQIGLGNGQIHTLNIPKKSIGIFQQKCAATTLGISCKLCEVNDIEICKDCKKFYEYETNLPLLYKEFPKKTYGYEIGYVLNKKGDCIVMFVGLKNGCAIVRFDNIFKIGLNLKLQGIDIKTKKEGKNA